MAVRRPLPTATKKMSYAAAMLDFFGKRADQTAASFMQEVKQLGDREAFIAELEANGYQVENKESVT